MDEIKKEMDWYPYIERFLQFRRIEIRQNEVEFFEQLKVTDLFGFDENYYYVIEVKKEEIAKDDYYNLKYIIENNILDKPIKGLLFGQCKNSKLYNIIMNDSNIELVTFRDIPYSIKHIFREIKHKSEYFNRQGKFYRKVFFYISASNIEYIGTGKNFIKVIYHISYRKRLIFKSEATNEESNYDNLCGYLYMEYEDESINEIVISKPTSVSIKMIRNKFYESKMLDIHDKSRGNINNLHITKIYESFYIILRYMDINTLGSNLEDNKLIINKYNKEIGIEFIKLSNYSKVAIWCNVKYSSLLYTWGNKKQNEFGFKNSDIIPHYIEYNKINYLEAINIIVENTLYEPVKKNYYSGNQSIITLSMEFKYKNKTKMLTEEYKVFTFNSITDVNFYLMCNIEIILDFEDKVLEKIETNKWDIVYIEERNFINNYLRDKILKKIKLIKTIRQCIKEFERKHGSIRD